MSFGLTCDTTHPFSRMNPFSLSSCSLAPCDRSRLPQPLTLSHVQNDKSRLPRFDNGVDMHAIMRFHLVRQKTMFSCLNVPRIRNSYSHHGGLLKPAEMAVSQHRGSPFVQANSVARKQLIGRVVSGRGRGRGRGRGPCIPA
jgi:hypothetical protein